MAEAVWQYSHHVLPAWSSHRGPDPDRGQLVGHLAGAGRHAQPQRLADQGRREVLDALERGFHRRVLRRAVCSNWLDKGKCQAQDRARHAAARTSRSAGQERKLGKALAEQLRREKAIMGVFDEGCMGMFNAIIPDDLLQPDRRVQGTAQPVGPVLRNHAGRRRRGHGRPQAGWKIAGMKFVTGTERRRRSDRRADSQAVQDVHRRRADRRRFRLPRDRHSVSAGPEGSVAGQRPGRRHAQQRRPPAGATAATAAACCTRASRCRISTKSTNAPGSTA